MQIFIREITIADATSVANLSGQLGYPLTAEQIQKNISKVINSKDHNAFVAELNDEVVGWIGVAQTIMLESLPYCEINGLVIDENYRGKGIGKLLIEKATQWAKQNGNDKIRLRCNVVRKETYRFYQHLGFKDVKKQTTFELAV